MKVNPLGLLPRTVIKKGDQTATLITLCYNAGNQQCWWTDTKDGMRLIPLEEIKKWELA